jgi:Inositol-pentakisphosphate 2-kinase
LFTLIVGVATGVAERRFVLPSGLNRLDERGLRAGAIGRDLGRIQRREFSDHVPKRKGQSKHAQIETMQLSVTETSPQEWRYISEGKYSIVLCYVGKSHSQFSGTVLRLKKTGPGLDVEPEDLTVAYQRSVIERLIPSEYLPQLSTVEVEKSWLENVAVLCDEMRPLNRRQSSQIDVSVKRAILATDLVGGATVSVEIKVCYCRCFSKRVVIRLTA